MFLIILIKSLIIGGPGWRRCGSRGCTHVPCADHSGMGAFRTLGELNSCEGDPASHFSFGLGFFFNAPGRHPLPQVHLPRTLTTALFPTGGAAALMVKNRNVGETLHDPKRWPLPVG